MIAVSHTKRRFVVPILMVTVLVTACSSDIVQTEESLSIPQQREAPTREILYLQNSLPACTSSVAAGVNPCPVETPTLMAHRAQGATYGNLPTYTDVMLGYGSAGSVTHIVTRGVVLPESTRCEVYQLSRFSFSDATGGVDAASYWYLCFAEIAVKEYIVGTGPPILTVELHFSSLYKQAKDDGTIQWWQLLNGAMGQVPEPQNPQTEVAGVYEGKELVLFLGTPITNKVETWSLLQGRLSFWFLQKHGDEVRAISAYYNEPNTTDLSKLDIPLTELVAEIKKADAERDRITGGRLIVTPDSDAAAAASDSNTPQPMIVTDANKLKDLYVASGVVYEGDNKTVLPPPPPEGYTPPPTTIVTTTSTTSSSTTTTTAATGLTLSVSDATATEGETMVFNVSLNKEPLGVQVVVNYQSQPVTATAGTDYTAPSGTFIFGPYDTVKTIRVGIKDDNRTEETETFQITLSQPYGATITKSVGTGTITDND